MATSLHYIYATGLTTVWAQTQTLTHTHTLSHTLSQLRTDYRVDRVISSSLQNSYSGCRVWSASVWVSHRRAPSAGLMEPSLQNKTSEPRKSDNGNDLGMRRRLCQKGSISSSLVSTILCGPVSMSASETEFCRVCYFTCNVNCDILEPVLKHASFRNEQEDKGASHPSFAAVTDVTQLVWRICVGSCYPENFYWEYQSCLWCKLRYMRISVTATNLFFTVFMYLSMEV